MMNTLVDMMKNFEKYKKYIENINLNNSPVMITGLTFASKSFFLVSTIASIIEQNRDKKKNIYYYIVENEIDIYKMREDIEYFAKDLEIEVLDFPKKDIRDFDIISESIEIYKKRMQVFNRIMQKSENTLKKNVIVILPIESLMQRIVPYNVLFKNKIELIKGQDITQNEIIKKLNILGYKREDVAENIGEYSIKGGIVDISDKEEEGIRIEFWGDIIESIRTYSNISQKSLKEIERIEILPLTEYIFDTSINNIILNIKENTYSSKENDEIEKIITRKKINKKAEYKEEINTDIERLEEGETNQLIEKYIDYFYEKKEYFIDYISEESKIFLDNYIKLIERSSGILKEAENQNIGLIERGRPLNQALDNMCNYKDILEKILEKEIFSIYLEEEKVKELDKNNKTIGKNKFDFNFTEYTFLKTKLQNLEEILKKEENKNDCIYIIAYENYNYILEHVLKKIEINIIDYNKKIKLLKGKISKGFSINDEKNNYLIISIDAETARNTEKRVGKNSLFTNAENIIFADLEQGDYIVHKINGIGKFIEIKKIEVQGISKDYIKIEYKDNDYLYVPTDDLSNVRKFIGAARK